MKPAGTPGYSTTNTIILQQIAEKVTGPLGLEVAAFPAWDDAALPSPGTHGYLNEASVKELVKDGGTAQDGQDTTSWNLTSSQGGGGAYSDLHDLGIWAGSMSGSALLSEELAAKRLETTPLPENVEYGLGIFKQGDWYGHSGELEGWEAYELHNPKTGVTVAVGTNAGAGGSVLIPVLLAQIYPNTGLFG